MIFTGTDSEGVFISGDGGVTWNSTGLANTNIYFLAAFGNYMIASANNTSIYISADIGTSWHASAALNTGFVGRVLVVDSLICVGTNGGVFVSADSIFSPSLDSRRHSDGPGTTGGRGTHGPS